MKFWREQSVISERKEFPPDALEFVEQDVIFDNPLDATPGLYQVQMLKAHRDYNPTFFKNYESERFASMQAHLRDGDILFDVGAEMAWQSAIYAQFVGGGQNMVLFEPSPGMWPIIKATWKANNLATPRGVYAGFVSNETIENIAPPPDANNQNGSYVYDRDFNEGYKDGWPTCAFADPVYLHACYYRHISAPEGAAGRCAAITPQITLDDYVQRTGIIPNAVSMDIEGAEWLALQGMKNILQTYRPLVWVSVHTIPPPLIGNYGATLDDVLNLMRDLNYRAQFLQMYNEEHWLFEPK